mmetsp:Transcript_2727/g.6198  ORF Transcript_2727/g.6198 Transcript_2727/m.6198 type:complete len:399 (+) Transcript_2727:926-2122(+)
MHAIHTELHCQTTHTQTNTLERGASAIYLHEVVSWGREGRWQVQVAPVGKLLLEVVILHQHQAVPLCVLERGNVGADSGHRAGEARIQRRTLLYHIPRENGELVEDAADLDWRLLGDFLVLLHQEQSECVFRVAHVSALLRLLWLEGRVGVVAGLLVGQLAHPKPSLVEALGCAEVLDGEACEHEGITALPDDYPERQSSWRIDLNPPISPPDVPAGLGELGHPEEWQCDLQELHAVARLVGLHHGLRVLIVALELRRHPLLDQLQREVRTVFVVAADTWPEAVFDAFEVEGLWAVADKGDVIGLGGVCARSDHPHTEPPCVEVECVIHLGHIDNGVLNVPLQVLSLRQRPHPIQCCPACSVPQCRSPWICKRRECCCVGLQIRRMLPMASSKTGHMR